MAKEEGAKQDLLTELAEQMYLSGYSYQRAMRAFQKAYLVEVMVACEWNQCRAARMLGIHRNNLNVKLVALGIEPRSPRQWMLARQGKQRASA